MTMIRRLSIFAAISLALLAAGDAVKPLTENQALKLQNLLLQYQLLVTNICADAGFPIAECEVRPEARLVVRIPLRRPEESRPPAKSDPLPSKPGI